jgi:hypothetical protein
MDEAENEEGSRLENRSKYSSNSPAVISDAIQAPKTPPRRCPVKRLYNLNLAVFTTL